MDCEYCLRLVEHDYRCPNYIPPKAANYCSVCGQGIYDGDDYVTNDDEDMAHIECLYDVKETLEWLGFDVKTYHD